MIVDVTATARIVRRIDESTTLRSFAAVTTLLVVLLNLAAITAMVAGFLAIFAGGGNLDRADTGVLVGAGIVTALIAVLGPFSFMLGDWVARRPWRPWAAGVGAAVGGFGTAALGALVSLFIGWLAADAWNEQRSLLPLRLATAGVLALVTLCLLGRSPRTRRLAAGLLLTLIGVMTVGGSFLLLSEGSPTSWQLVGTFTAYFALAAAAFWLIARVVALRLVLSGRVPRALFFGDFQEKGLWARFAFLAGFPSSMWGGASLRTPAFWAFATARTAVYVGALLLLGRLLAFEQLAVQLSIGAAVVAAGHAALVYAKRLGAREIWKVDATKTVRPILFLRSFEDDQLEFTVPRWRLLRRWLELWSFRRNADETLVDEIAQYGPVVALGRPGEKAPPFGAQRHYSSHDDWKKIITDTARVARSIVIGAGSTPGVLWEYELLVREGLLDKTLLLFPNRTSSADNESALAAFVQSTGVGPALRAPGDQMMVALLPTREGPVLLTAREPSGAACMLALRAHFQGATAAELSDPVSEFRGIDD